MGGSEGEAYKSAERYLASWMTDREHSANQKDKTALEKVRDYMICNQFSLFTDCYDERNRPTPMMGFLKVDKGGNDSEPVTTFYAVPSGRKEICKGFDARKVARLCVAAGWLEPGNEGRTQRSVRLPEIGVKRVYQFSSLVLGSAEPA